MSTSDVLSEGIYNAYWKDPNGEEYKQLLAKYFGMLRVRLLLLLLCG
ncbi:hypothetical protein FACS189472_15780 [Alphaproteobacteria bacterium]|nr:hypothetical protein FACS189472_15780 [Alphaproteobacteria bacterium]